ncbi:MAG: orotidine-5'-phosphate decarboxylase [Coxiellaceae bacterium]|nr:orotidine-5'-phosphate decarboxylase [Coxiellaceae bacterium]
MSKSPIIVALDYDDIEPARQLVNKLSPELCRLKVGKQMFTQYGPQWIEELVGKGFDIFLDLKFHDIPNTVAKACISAANLGVWMMNVHASGGLAMMESARQALDSMSGNDKPLLIAVTILTSMQQTDLQQIGLSDDVRTCVERLAQLAYQAECDGVVCSAQEATMLRQLLGNDFCLVTPGIRLAGDDQQDQKRVMTPEAAMMAGANYLVMGRSITQSDDPAATLQSILLSSRTCLSSRTPGPCPGQA